MMIVQRIGIGSADNPLSFFFIVITCLLNIVLIFCGGNFVLVSGNEMVLVLTP